MPRSALDGGVYSLATIVVYTAALYTAFVGFDRRAYPNQWRTDAFVRDLPEDAMLTVPMSDHRVAFIHLERRGVLPDGYRGSEETAAFSVPVGELEAVVALMAGIAAHARADGVLPRQALDTEPPSRQ